MFLRATGHLVYVKKGSLLATPFDAERLEVRSASVTLAEVSSNNSVGFSQFDSARSGALAYRTGGTQDLLKIEWLDDAGKTEPLIPEPAFYEFPRLSPDGCRVASIINGPSPEVFVFDWRRGRKARLANTANAPPELAANHQ